MSNYITTYSKIKMNPLDAKNEEISINDIAHSLSLMCRANGHFPEFYSVAQHCICCCEEALARNYDDTVALACLLHDASEAYLADITRPVKHNLSTYLDIEKKLQESIYKKYLSRDLSLEDREKINLIDNALLYHEFLHYMKEALEIDNTKIYSTPKFKFQDFKTVENRYKELFYLLTYKK